MAPCQHMTSIYLKHPVHGAKVAIAEAEAAYDEKSGWVRYDPTKTTPPAVEITPLVNAMVATVATDEPAPPIRRRRARQE
jgi:hypothetical protein